jgi:guanylate kinase
VLHNSRAPRPGEQDGVDYHFRTRAQVEALKADPRYAVLDVRGDLQALDLEALSARLRVGDALFEGNPFVGGFLQTHPALASARPLGIFVSPLSMEEVAFLRGQPQVSLPDLVCDVMRRKLLRRTRRQKGELSRRDLEEVERRAGSAYAELALAHRFGNVIPNHDGEDSDNWDAFYYPLGDARTTLLAIVGLLRGETPPGVERWDADLVPGVS